MRQKLGRRVGMGGVLGVLALYACSSTDSAGTPKGSSSDAGLDGQALADASGSTIDAETQETGLTPDSACASELFEAGAAQAKFRPMDIIFVIDNSASMGDEILTVQDNINQSFAYLIQQSGIDFRGILLSEHGPPTAVCVSGALNPNSNCTNVPTGTAPTLNPPFFYHYDNGRVESQDSWCKILSWYKTPDKYGLAPGGYSQWLRKDAFKVFVEITDDSVHCGSFFDQTSANGGTAAAQAFDQALLALDPSQFGTAEQRNYVWHSIAAFQENSPWSKPFEPQDPIVTSICKPDGTSPGTGYQALSKLTGGLRFPVCMWVGYELIFKKIAAGVIDGAKVPCEFEIPADPPKGKIDRASIVVEYSSDGLTQPALFDQVENSAACKPGAFYIEQDTIFLCPDTCTTITADDTAKLQVLYGCLLEPR